jgi:hypothetical protein
MKYRAVMLVLSTAVCVTSLGMTAFAADNFTGTWKLDFQKSTYDPRPPPRSLTSHVQMMGDAVDFTFDGYDASGKAITPEEIMVKLDGKDYAIEGDTARDSISIKKIDDYTTEEISKKGGKVTTITRTVYAKDGKSRTATTTGTNAQGQKVSNIAVFNRLN